MTILLFKQEITRAYIREKFGTHIFLYGDNMGRSGLGGQAKEIRGEPNSFGVPTKWAPNTHENAYFAEEDIYDEAVNRALDFPFNLARSWLMGGFRESTVVIPAEGIGTGLSKLEEKAPGIFQLIQLKINELKPFSTRIINE